MRTTFILIIFASLLISCDSIKPVFEKADYVEITLYGRLPDKIDHKYKTITIKNRNEITMIAGYITRDDAPLYKCGYTGSILFLKNGSRSSNVLFDAEFNLAYGCRHIIFFQKGELISKRLSDEGIKYLGELYRKNVKQQHWLFVK
jgi:hypothetical protein